MAEHLSSQHETLVQTPVLQRKPAGIGKTKKMKNFAGITSMFYSTVG
jgi:hypothetical protein